MAFMTALSYTKQHLYSYRSRDPENACPNDNILQLLWLGSHCHNDVTYGTLPSRSKLIPISLTIGLTQLFYLARRRQGPHIRKTDKGIGLGLQTKKWLKTERTKVLTDPTKYIEVQNPDPYTLQNASRIYVYDAENSQGTNSSARTHPRTRILIYGSKCQIYIILRKGTSHTISLPHDTC